MKKLNYIPNPCTKEDVDKILNTLFEVDIIGKTESEKREYQVLVDFLMFIKQLVNSKFDPSKHLMGANKRIESYNNRIG